MLKIWNMLSGFENKLMGLTGSSVAAKVFIKFILNVTIFVIGFYIFTGIFWALAHIVPQELAQDEKFNKSAAAVVGSAGAAYVLIGIWCVFRNTNQFRKALRNSNSAS